MQAKILPTGWTPRPRLPRTLPTYLHQKPNRLYRPGIVAGQEEMVFCPPIPRERWRAWEHRPLRKAIQVKTIEEWDRFNAKLNWQLDLEGTSMQQRLESEERKHSRIEMYFLTTS